MIPEAAWPDHPFAPDEYGHNCSECGSESAWKCDKVAHDLGDHARGLMLLDVIQDAK